MGNKPEKIRWDTTKRWLKHPRIHGRQAGREEWRQAGLRHEPRSRTQHPRPGQIQNRKHDRRQARDKRIHYSTLRGRLYYNGSRPSKKRTQHSEQVRDGHSMMTQLPRPTGGQNGRQNRRPDGDKRNTTPAQSIPQKADTLKKH